MSPDRLPANRLPRIKYRKRSELQEIAADAASLAQLVGEDKYRSILMSLGKGLNNKGYVTELDDLRFGLELQLYNIELARQGQSGIGRLSRKVVHEGIDFVLGIGQTISQLSPTAREELKCRIVGGLQKDGLRPLYHEFRVAARLANIGSEFSFSDLETGGGPDFLAQRDGIEFEVEARNFTMFTGQPLQPQDIDNLFLEIRRGFDGWTDREQYPAFTITFRRRLPKSREDHLVIVDALNQLASSLAENDYAETDLFRIEFSHMVSKREYVRLKKALYQIELPTRSLAYVPFDHPRVIVNLKSDRKDRFFKTVTSEISEKAKRQLTGTRPSVVWAHIDYMTQSSFEFYAHPNSPTPLFGSIASAIFASAKRRHVTQLIISGASFLDRRDDNERSSFKSVVYNSPHWSGPFLFEGGRQQRPRRPNEIDLLRMIRQNHRSK